MRNFDVFAIAKTWKSALAVAAIGGGFLSHEESDFRFFGLGGLL
jgi:hypothetical protein